jgi:hypothetical protein
MTSATMNSTKPSIPAIGGTQRIALAVLAVALLAAAAWLIGDATTPSQADARRAEAAARADAYTEARIKAAEPAYADAYAASFPSGAAAGQAEGAAAGRAAAATSQ